MQRSDLERLDRDSLIARAESLGVTRASVLTRPELVDELLIRSAKRKDDPAGLSLARGLFGRARDLLARVIERGLHLPEAADLVRAHPSSPPPPRGAASAVPTLTLAEIYAAQGHKERALDTLRRVIDSEPDHAPARSLLERLEATDLPKPPLPPEEDEEAASARALKGGAEAPPAEPMGMLDDAPLPPKYDVDECVAIPVDPRTMFVYWEVRDETRAHLEKSRPGGTVFLRVLVIEATWDGPKSHVRDIDVYNPVGEWFVRELPAECVVRAAIGWRTPQGVFVPIAHSPALEVPPDSPSAVVGDTLVRWTPQGLIPIALSDADAHGIRHAVDRVQAKEHAKRRRGGSSELSMAGSA